jgi:DNA-binding beta-propeller fold protein YncE
VWQFACDDHKYVRFDAVTNEARQIDTKGHEDLIVVDGRLIATAPEGLAQFDPGTGTFRPIGGCCGRPVGFDGTAVWLSDDHQVVRVNLATGKVISKLALENVATMAMREGHAWVAAQYRGIYEVDVATNAVLRTITGPSAPVRILAVGGALWLTDFETSRLYRLQP